MQIYSILLCLLTALSVLELLSQWPVSIKIRSIYTTINFKKFLIFAIALSLTMISALRDLSIGRDLINYIPRYTSLGKCEWSKLFLLADSYSFEYGFSIFCKILYMISPDPGLFIVATSVVTGLGFYQLSKLSKMPINTYFIIYCYGIYGSSMSIIRQFLAFSIFIFGIRYILNRKFWKFLLVVLIATTFHTGALLFIFLYFLYNIQFDAKSFVIVIVGGFFLAIFGNRILRIVMSRTSFAWYFARLGRGSGESTLILLFAMLCGVFFYRKKIFEINIQDNLYIWSLVIAIAFNCMALSFGILARAMLMFTPFTAVLIPDLIFALKKKRNDIFLIIGIFVIAFYIFYFEFIIMQGTAQADAWYPYIIR